MGRGVSHLAGLELARVPDNCVEWLLKDCSGALLLWGSLLAFVLLDGIDDAPVLTC